MDQRRDKGVQNQFGKTDFLKIMWNRKTNREEETEI